MTGNGANLGREALAKARHERTSSKNSGVQAMFAPIRANAAPTCRDSFVIPPILSPF